MSTDRTRMSLTRVLVVAVMGMVLAAWPFRATASSVDSTTAAAVAAQAPITETADRSGAEAAPYAPPNALPGAVGYLRDARGAVCTATVVASGTGSVAATAGHCVYVPERALSRVGPAAVPGWKNGLTFTPGTDLTSAPFGAWDVDRVEVHPDWLSDGRQGADIAFIHLRPLNGRTVQQVVGAHVLSRAPDVENDLTYTAVGFPRDGSFRENLQAQECSSAWEDLDGGGDTSGGFYMMQCDMTGGASGGPWLTKVSESGSGVGALVAVTTARAPDRVHDRPGVIMLHAVIVNDRVLDLHSRIDT